MCVLARPSCASRFWADGPIGPYRRLGFAEARPQRNMTDRAVVLPNVLHGNASQGSDALAREQKLALIVGFSITLLVGILLTDHLSKARMLRLEGIAEGEGPALVNVSQRSALSPREHRAERRAGAMDPRGRDSAPEPLSRPGSGASARADLDDEGEIAASLALPDPAVDQAPVLTMGESIDDLVGPTGEPAGGRPANRLGRSIEAPGETHLQGPMIADPLEAAPTPEWYTVQKNESLYTLCERFYGNGMLYPKLIAHNTERVNAEGHIREGVRIQIPHPSVIVGPGASFKTSPGKTPGSKGEQKAPKLKTREYRVAKGDCLSLIAQRELGTIRRQKEIIELNDLRSPDDVRRGMILILPAS